MQQPPNDPTQPSYPPPPPYTQYPPMQQPPKPKKRRIWPWIVGGIIALIVIVSVLSNQNNSQTSTPPAATQAPAGNTPAATQPPAATPTPSPVPKWTTVQTFRGNGNKKTGNFTVPDSWRLVWSCDPSSSFGGSYNVIVDVNNSDGTPLDLGAINTICSSTNKGDMTEEHQGGTVYLDITSEGAWVIKIQVLK